MSAFSRWSDVRDHTHQYRVTQTLPWIEGGRPGPPLGWVGGTSVVYHKDQMIRVDDREVPGIEHYQDAGGRAVLERVHRTLDPPATVTPAVVVQPDGTAYVDGSPGSLHLNASVWLARVADEQLCQAGRGSPKKAGWSREAYQAIDLHFHDLKHEAGSRWQEAGVPLHHVKELLGHANIATTDTYLNARRVHLKASIAAADARKNGANVALSGGESAATPTAGIAGADGKPLVN